MKSTPANLRHSPLLRSPRTMTSPPRMNVRTGELVSGKAGSFRRGVGLAVMLAGIASAGCSDDSGGSSTPLNSDGAGGAAATASNTGSPMAPVTPTPQPPAATLPVPPMAPQAPAMPVADTPSPETPTPPAAQPAEDEPAEPSGEPTLDAGSSPADESDVGDASVPTDAGDEMTGPDAGDEMSSNGGAGGMSSTGGAGGVESMGGAGGESSAGAGGEPPELSLDGGLYVDGGADAGETTAGDSGLDAGSAELDSGSAEEPDGSTDAGAEPEPEPEPEFPWALTLECALPQGGESVNPFNLTFNLTNDEAMSLDLSLVEIHYFLGGDGNTSNTIVEYYDESGEATEDAVDMGTLSTTGADTRIEIVFGGGTLASGDTLDLQLGVTGDQSNHNTNNDYSSPLSTTATACEYAAVYYDGVLTYGIPPATAAE